MADLQMPDAMTDRTQTSANSDAARPSFWEAFSVYFKPRVLIVLFLGFSAGLPLALSGATLLYWTAEAGVNLQICGRRLSMRSTCQSLGGYSADGAAG
jgi:PAT family beta-lactamase induction signal transducer AmpG